MNRTARLPYQTLAPAPYKAMLQVSEALYCGVLGRELIDLVFLRVSQINGCAYCIDLHWRDLAKQGVDARRLNSLAAWQESPFFDDRVRAALAWTELVTRIPASHPSDADFAALREQLADAEVAELGIAIATMNGLNRLAIGFRNPIPA